MFSTRFIKAVSLLIFTSIFIIPASVKAQISKTKAFSIVLDPGHGGKDSATRADGFYEKHIVLDIAKGIKKHLVNHGFDVVLTREVDEFVSLSDRSAYVGDIFISLHANTVPDTIGPSVRTMIKGIEIFTDYSIVNRPVLLSNSKLLAEMFKQQLAEVKGVRMRGVKQKPLAVLNKNESPAILIELGFISNKEDLAFLINAENHKPLADAFVRAIDAYQLAVKAK